MALEVDLATVGGICGIAASIWLIVRDVVPVVSRAAPRVARFLKSKYAERRAAVARRRAQLAEQVLRAEHSDAHAAFEASVRQVLKMEQGTGEYHPTEWKRQIESCKQDTLRILRRIGVTMGSGSVQLGPWIGNFESGSIIVDWGPSKWNLGRVQLVVLWHPNPKLTHGEFHNSYFPDGKIEHVKVLSKPLTDADMEVAGWTYFDGWHTDYGYDGSEWIPVGAPDSDGH